MFDFFCFLFIIIFEILFKDESFVLATVIITSITFILITCSILFFPSVKVKGKKISLYYIIAFFGAVLLLATSLVPFSEVAAGLVASNSVNPLKILILFFSMTFLSVFLDEAGLFSYLAAKAVKRAKTNQISLFLILYFLTATLTVFTSNDVVILTLTPFICLFCKNTKINPVPYLVGEFAAANTWSMMFIIGNPTNVYLGTYAGITFTEYFKVMCLPTVFAGIIELILILLIFNKALKKPLSVSEDKAEVSSKEGVIIGVIHMAICLVFLVISGYVNLEMWLISAVFSVSLLFCSLILSIVKKKNLTLLLASVKRFQWELIPFVLSMYVIVVCLNYQGVSGELAKLLGSSSAVWTYGGASFIFANVINNIPMSILFSTVSGGLSGGAYLQAVYASIIGSNVGAFLTPIGALAGIMFTSLLSKYDVKYGFKEFIKYGAIISVPTVLAALFVLFLLV